MTKNLIFSNIVFPIAAVAWVSLAVWSQSPFANFLDHGDWTKAGLFSAICSVDLSLGLANSTLLTLATWILMIFAMMFPTASSLIDRVTHNSTRGGQAYVILVSSALLGYLGFWIVFGILAHSFGYVIQELVSMSVWWSINGWATGAGVFAIAGIYQLTPIKSRYIDACCRCLPSDKVIAAPFHNKTSETINALKSGWMHGMNCVVCCWSLMLLMFIFWPGSLVWMFALTILMIVDRTTFISVSLHKPIGWGLIATSLAIVTVSNW